MSTPTNSAIWRFSFITFLLALLLTFGLQTANAQYCITNLHQNACGGNGNGFLDTLLVANTAFRPSLPKACAGATYLTFGQDTASVLRLNQGDSATFVFRTLGQASVSGWIDYNQNQIFEPSEWINLSRGGPAGNLRTANFVVPFNATLGNTRLRVRTRITPSQNEAPDACLRFASGITFDFNVVIGQGTLCTGILLPPTIQEDRFKLCVNDSALIAVSSPITAGGFNWQWQSSNDGLTYSNIIGATSITYKLYQRNLVADSVFIRLRQNCSAGTDTAYTVSILIRKEVPSLCFCNTALHRNACDIAGYMPDSLGILNTFFAPALPTVCTGTLYRFSDAPNEVAFLEQGAPYTITYTSPGGVSVSAFIDYNGNGIFELNEWIDLGRNSNQGTKVNTTFVTSGNSVVGTVGFRIRIRGAGAANGPADACLEFGSGFTLDFKANLLPGLGCQLLPQNQSIKADTTLICGFDSTTIRILAAPNGVGTDITWSTSQDGINYIADNNYKGSTYNVAGPRMLADSLFVRMSISCPTTGQANITPAILIKKRPIIACYCTANIHQNRTCANFINFFTIINTSMRFNLRTCPAGGLTYYRFPNQDSTTAILRRGATFALNYQTNANNNISAWLDNDQSGSFSANEWYDLGRNVNPNVISRANLAISATAKLGPTTLRIRMRGLPSNNGGGDACTQFNSGITYDLPVTIVPVTTDVPNGLAKSTGLSIYPNPSAGTFNLSLNLVEATITSTIITDLAGKIVAKPTISNGQLISDGGGVYQLNTNLHAGIYILTVSTGTKVMVQKLVVE